MATTETQRKVEAREAWLAQVTEPAIEPQLPIIDPHHHLWDHPGSRYCSMRFCATPTRGIGCCATVFVECFSMYRAGRTRSDETGGRDRVRKRHRGESASGQYGDTRVAAGIVSFADLALGAAVEEVLQAHIAAAPARFRGIRHAAGWDAHPDIRNSHTNPPHGSVSVGALSRRLCEVERTEPQLRCVALSSADGGSDGAREGISRYENCARSFRRATRGRSLRRSSARKSSRNGKRTSRSRECPNVVVKLGGINMPVNGFGWHRCLRRRLPRSSRKRRRLLSHTIEQFGPSRCMFESNFPVDRVSCSYVVLWNAFKHIAARFTADEKAGCSIVLRQNFTGAESSRDLGRARGWLLDDEGEVVDDLVVVDEDNFPAGDFPAPFFEAHPMDAAPRKQALLAAPQLVQNEGGKDRRGIVSGFFDLHIGDDPARFRGRALRMRDSRNEAIDATAQLRNIIIDNRDLALRI